MQGHRDLTTANKTLSADVVEHCRRQFPALSRQINDKPAVFFDGPAGTQVPQRVIDMISHYLANMNANHEGLFATSQESDVLLAATHAAVATLLGANDPSTVFFGPNMTTLTFALSRSLANMWRQGDEIVVTRLDHDANVTPWVFAAREVGATVRFVEINRDDCTLDLDDLRSKLNENTRLVAVGCASNSVGSINPVADICRWAHEVGAFVFLDAVHYAPHALIDVQAWDCDFLACSAYKFFGPHIGIMWGRRELLEGMLAYKVRPASNDLPEKWMTGTQNHECLAGVFECVRYLADLGRTVAADNNLEDRAALQAAYEAIANYEQSLVGRLIVGLKANEKVTIYGITDPERAGERMPTVSITHSELTASQLARALGEQGIFTWHGNYYALQLTDTLGLEPEGMVRIGLVHYNTPEEVDRLLETLKHL
jgi:cysteine desulfurase family protein (TIGR01976 family)